MRYSRGLTLLELLLVVAILSAMAVMTVSSVSDGTSQVRRDDTVTRLKILHSSIVGYPNPVYDGQRLFSGFAADNGIVPSQTESISALVTKPDDFDEIMLRNPVFDPEPDVEGYSNGADQFELEENNEKLFKGWREGGYISSDVVVSTDGSDDWALAVTSGPRTASCTTTACNCKPSVCKTNTVRAPPIRMVSSLERMPVI